MSPFATRRRRTVNGGLPSDFGRAGDHDPELLDRFDNGGQLIEVIRLNDVTVRVVVIGGVNISVGFRGGEHQHGDSSKRDVIFHPAEHFATVHLGQIPVQKNDIGEGRVFFVALREQLQSLLTIVRDRNLPVNRAALAKCVRNQVEIRKIVFDHEQADNLTVALTGGVFIVIFQHCDGKPLPMAENADLRIGSL